jgi:hypothetical protein
LAALRALPAPVQLRINQLAKKNIWHRDCHCQRYMNANQDLSVTSKIFSEHSRNEKVIKDDGKS